MTPLSNPAPLPGPGRAGWLNKDVVGGALIGVLGAAAAWEAQSYGIGSLRHMGAGFFPVTLGVLMVATGLVLITMGLLRAAPRFSAVRPEWKGWFCIAAGIIAFVVLGEHGGLLPATFACVFIAALGDRKNSVLGALILAAAMTAIGVVVFFWALRIQLPLLQWD
jgi:hypothetical protein